MIIRVGPEKTIAISNLQEKVICDLINREEFLDLLHTEILQIINRLYTSSLRNLKNTWIEKLEDRVPLPADDANLIELIFSHPDYLDRLDREIEAQAARTAKFDIR